MQEHMNACLHTWACLDPFCLHLRAPVEFQFSAWFHRHQLPEHCAVVLVFHAASVSSGGHSCHRLLGDTLKASHILRLRSKLGFSSPGRFIDAVARLRNTRGIPWPQLTVNTLYLQSAAVKLKSAQSPCKAQREVSVIREYLWNAHASIQSEMRVGYSAQKWVTFYFRVFIQNNMILS